MRLPKNISPAAAARRSLLLDVFLGLLIAICVVIVAAGIGVVGLFALLCAAILIPWYVVEGAIHAARRRRRDPRASSGRSR